MHHKRNLETTNHYLDNTKKWCIKKKEHNFGEYCKKHASNKKVPKRFWTEAVKWEKYVLNRIPTLSCKYTTPKDLGVVQIHYAKRRNNKI